jgi:hypothetical protein
MTKSVAAVTAASKPVRCLRLIVAFFLGAVLERVRHEQIPC